MLTYKAMYKVEPDGVHAEVLDYPGAISCGSDLAEARKQAALSGQGQACHSPVHERRAVARRYVRSQAGARKVRRQGTADGEPATERKTGAAFPFALSSSRSTARAASRSARCFSTRPAHRRHRVIRSMHADVPNHEPSLLLMNCGDSRQVRPSMGSWVTYGLGPRIQNLPGFIAMCPNGYPIKETQNWQWRSCPACIRGRTSTRSTPKSTS
jgi:hypothetical protein